MANPNPKKDTQFKKGEGGRKEGGRNKITKQYLDNLMEAWDPNVIETLKETKPEVYIKLYSQLVPKNYDVKGSGDVTVRIIKFADKDKQARK